VSFASAGAPVAVRECTNPSVGFPTCYSLQVDGTWAREELAGVDSGWVVVGTVTYDEVISAVQATRTVEDQFEGCVAVTQDEVGCNQWAMTAIGDGNAAHPSR